MEHKKSNDLECRSGHGRRTLVNHCSAKLHSTQLSVVQSIRLCCSLRCNYNTPLVLHLQQFSLQSNCCTVLAVLCIALAEHPSLSGQKVRSLHS